VSSSWLRLRPRKEKSRFGCFWAFENPTFLPVDPQEFTANRWLKINLLEFFLMVSTHVQRDGNGGTAAPVFSTRRAGDNGSLQVLQCWKIFFQSNFGKRRKSSTFSLKTVPFFRKDINQNRM
jgi:hypothetical protein